MVVEMTHNRKIFSRNRTAAEGCNQVISDTRKAKENRIRDISNITKAKIDDSKSNRGCAMRQNWSSRKNVEFFDEVIQAINGGVFTTLT